MEISVVFGVLFLLWITLLIRLFLRSRHMKKGKEKKVREEYAAECVRMLFILAADTVAVIISSYSIWDLLGDFFGVKTEEPMIIRGISIVAAVVVFFLCYRLVCRTYSQWDGPVSRRQHYMNCSRMEDGHLMGDFLYCLLYGTSRKNPELREYIPFQEEEIYSENSITGELPWHIEFARIYSIMSNQAHINVKKDWHPQAHCFISEYDEKKIAVYCSHKKPKEEEIYSFLEYIHKIHSRYLQIIVAIKDCDQENYEADVAGNKVQFMFKEKALEQLVDFSEYYDAIETLYKRPIMSRSSLRIEDIYVEPFCELEKDGEKKQLNEYVRHWLVEEGNRHLALLGDFGQGKTLFSTELTFNMIKEKNKRIPILIPLRNKSPRNSTRTEILAYFSVQYGINAEALDILNRNGRLLLIFDGFDEMDLVGNDDIRMRHFKSLWTLASPKSKILITGRPNYFLSRDEMDRALGFQTESGPMPYCEDLRLLLFDETQIKRALRNAPKKVQDGISYIIENKMSESFFDMIRRPSHLFLVSLIWDERELEKKYKNLTSASVINEFLQSCFERQSEKSTEIPYFYLSPIEREYFMIGIAVKMYKMGITSISMDIFQDTIMDLIWVFPEQLSRKNPVNINLRNGKSVKEFADKDNDSMLAIINDVRSCGVLVSDYANNGLTFAHKSFFDFLTAKFFMGKTLRLHDQNMLISDTISSISTFNIKLKNDFVVRKLTAELISAEIASNPHQNTERAKCRKMYEQCYKIILRLPFRLKPQSVLKMCLKEQKIWRHIDVEPWKRENEFKRVIFIFSMLMLVMLIFLGRTAMLMFRYRGEAKDKFEVLMSVGAQSGHVSSFPWIIIFVVILAVGVINVVRQLENKAELTIRSRADIMLLTWYYSCVENHISVAVILRNFSKTYRHMFLEYVEDENLNEVNDQK